MSAYEDDDLTQITAGITLGVDHDGVVGLNLLTIAATAANGYGAGQDYSLVITTGTVGGVSVVGEVVGEFSLGLSAAFTRIGATGSGLTSLAQASVVGALADAAATGDPTAVDTLMQYLKQLVNLLAGTAGIATMPAGADPANGVNLFEMVRGALGATFAGATDSQEAIRNRGDAAWLTALNDPTAAAIADAIWDELRAAHVIAGSFGQGVASVQGNVTGSVASVTGAVGSVTGNVGGNVAGDVQGNVNGSVASVTAGVLVAVGGIGATAFAVNAIDAAALAQDAAQEIADEILNRNLAGGGSGDTRNVRNALRAVRNRVAIVAGTATVFEEDDVTPAWTAVITTTAGDPISEVNPAGP